jgi:hypothetical protein
VPVEQASNLSLSLDFRRHAQDLRRTWQGAALAASLLDCGEWTPPRHKVGMCILSVLSHNFDDAMPVMLRVVFPNFKSIGAPFLCSAAKIAKTGHVMADLITKDGQRVRNQALFRSTKAMEGEFRKFADGLRLDDAERTELFAAVKRWVVCDYRLDPQMNPADPDAKRLTVN